MDRFLIKAPKANNSKKTHTHKKIPRLKQTKLIDSPKVVHLDKLKEAKDILKTAENPELLIRTLDDLSEKLPPIEILQNIKIGKHIKALCNHSDSRVASKASEVVSKWTAYVKHTRSRPILDVKCGKAETERRDTAKRLIREALEGKIEGKRKTFRAESLAEDLEFKIFQDCGKQLRNGYPKTIRTLVRSLKGAESQLISRVLSRDLNLDDLIKQLARWK